MTGCLLDPTILPSLVGVIDLKQGRPVRAVAGERARYQPVRLAANRPALTATDLASHYRRLGVTRIYLADLDGICDGCPQWPALDELLNRCGRFDEVLLDLGWTGTVASGGEETLSRWLRELPELRLIAAAESAQSPDAVTNLCQLASPSRTLVGLDYRNGRWLGNAASEADWITAGLSAGVVSAVVLDLAAVGTSRGAVTATLCRRLKTDYPGMTIYSGGGIRSAADAQSLRQAGCDACLVATSLLQQGQAFVAEA